MNRADMVNQKDQQEWSNYYGRQGVSVYYTDANAGKGITKVLLQTLLRPNTATAWQVAIMKQDNCPLLLRRQAFHYHMLCSQINSDHASWGLTSTSTCVWCWL